MRINITKQSRRAQSVPVRRTTIDECISEVLEKELADDEVLLNIVSIGAQHYDDEYGPDDDTQVVIINYLSALMSKRYPLLRKYGLKWRKHILRETLKNWHDWSAMMIEQRISAVDQFNRDAEWDKADDMRKDDF